MDDNLRRYLELHRTHLDQQITASKKKRLHYLVASQIFSVVLIVSAIADLLNIDAPSATESLLAAITGAGFAMAGFEEQNLRRARQERQNLDTVLPAPNAS